MKNIKRIKNLTCGSLSALLLFSCTKDVSLKVDEKYTQPMLVVNGVLQVDSTIKVNISKSVSAFDPTASPSVLTDAKVELWKDGNLYAQLKNDGNGYYSSTEKPTRGHLYSFHVTQSSFTEPATATSSIPDSVAIKIVAVDTTAEEITVEINDPDTSNYYAFHLVALDSMGYANDLTLYTDNTELLDNAKSPIFSFTRHNSRKLHRLPNYVSDNLFNGTKSEYVLSFNTDQGFGGGGHGGPPPPPNGGGNNMPSGTYILTVYTVSVPLYKYVKSIDGASNPNPFAAEPTQIYSNVQNGLGVLGAINAQRYYIQKK